MAFFEYMGSYLLRSQDGGYYLWENQTDILYDLGRSREDVQCKLSKDTNWDSVAAIDPHNIRELAERQKPSEAKWEEYFVSLMSEYDKGNTPPIRTSLEVGCSIVKLYKNNKFWIY